MAAKPTYGTLAEFKPDEEFSAYLERVDLFFQSNDVPAEKKVPIFLNCIGSATYILLCELSFRDLAAILQAYFEPKPIVIAE